MTERNELTAPIRLYWDVGPPPPGASGLLERICDAIVSSKVLSLELRETADALGSSCLSILRHLSRTPVALSLTLPSSALDSRASDLLLGVKLRKLFVLAASSNDLPMIADVLRHVRTIAPIGLSFEVDKRNYPDLPDVLSFCIRSGMKDLVLPMQRFADAPACFTMTSEERRTLTAVLDKVAERGSLKITIHDPFLWRAFYPTSGFPGMGCQAADTMLYISPAFDVYPCPSLPMKLGSLLEGSLAEIIGSRERREVRKALDAPPGECGDCEERLQCMGGCRGRTFALTGSLQTRDPACT